MCFGQLVKKRYRLISVVLMHEKYTVLRGFTLLDWFRSRCLRTWVDFVCEDFSDVMSCSMHRPMSDVTCDWTEISAAC